MNRESLFDRLLGRIPPRLRIGGITWILYALLWASAFYVGWMVKAPVIHRTRVVHLTSRQELARASAGDIEKAWGQPSHTSKSGSLTCSIYDGKRAVICR